MNKLDLAKKQYIHTISTDLSLTLSGYIRHTSPSTGKFTVSIGSYGRIITPHDLFPQQHIKQTQVRIANTIRIVLGLFLHKTSAGNLVTFAIMAEGGYGGYEYDFVDEIDKKYLCLVCHNVICDPMLTDCCGQHYCQSGV